MRRVPVFLLLLYGCTGGDAGVELRAGDVLDKAADVFQAAVDEYHDEVTVGDDAREAAIAAAFVARVKANPDNPQDVADFLAAGQKIRADREIEWQRYTTSRDNVNGLREVAASLRNLATQSLTLNDEARRYFTTWIEAAKTARAEASAQRQAERQQRREAIAGFVGTAAAAIKPQPTGGAQ